MHGQWTVLKRNVFNLCLKMSSEMSGDRKSTGRLFHTAGPLTEKLLDNYQSFLLYSRYSNIS